MIKRIRKFCHRRQVNLCFKKFVIPFCAAFVCQGSFTTLFLLLLFQGVEIG